MITNNSQPFEELAKQASFHAATPIVLALMECDPELRDQAVELFQQLASGELDECERFATTSLITEILFPLPIEDEASDEQQEAEPNDPHAFTSALKMIMQQRGLTQAQLADLVGIGQSSISMILNRQCRPQRKTVLKFAQALSVDPQQLWATTK
jgi:predicted XRE-type DNA-binding protein